MILVNKPFLPPIEEYEDLLKGIWQRRWLTNMGQLSTELEEKLKIFLQVKELLFVTSGTTALQMAIKALDLKGEVITTPFSFVATSSTIVWEGCTPVFVDIDENTLNIDVSRIEEAITEKTTAIIATHIFGNPCEVDKIEEIARKYSIKIIYDAAHAFGVKLKGRSVFEHGDISACSLHATKVFHSVEGGLLFTKDKDLHKKLSYMRNFGFDGPEAFAELGINGKNSEFHAAMGLANINYISIVHSKRKILSERYDENLKNFKATKPLWHRDATKNYAYYPLILESEVLLLSCMEQLKAHNILARRHFYPSLPGILPYVDTVNLPVTDTVIKRVLCLPLFHDLTLEEVDKISEVLLGVWYD